MKSTIKNIALASTVLLTPLKSSNIQQPTINIGKNIIEKTDWTKPVWNNNTVNYYIPNFVLKKCNEHETQKTLNHIKVPKPHVNLDISKTKYSGHPEFLNTFLGGVLKGKAKQFIKAQEKYGINATFLIGVANQESGNGLSGYARNRNNIAGMRGKDGYMYFSSVNECIDKMAANLKKNYIDKGYKTIAQINKKYAESTEWTEHVITRMNPMYKASKCKIYEFEK